MAGHFVREAFSVGTRLPQAEGGKLADWGFADADHVDEPVSGVQFDVDFLGGVSEITPGLAIDVSAGDDCDRAVA